MVIEVKDAAKYFAVITTIERSPRQHAGWQSVRYLGKRYQLFGGIRKPYFIDLTNPIKSRKDNRP